MLSWALLFISFSASKAQPIDQTTGNLVYTTVNPPPNGWAGNTWTGFTNNVTNGGGLSGGNQPNYNPLTGTFMFGYSWGTVSYSTSVNTALANAGTGIQVSGYQYSWQYINQDFTRGTLTGNISLTSNTGTTLQSFNYSMPQTTSGWTNVSGVQNFNTQYAPSSLGNLVVSFTGKDDRFWAGYYGPQIKDIDVRLRYSVDPCATNPAYSPSCAGFSSVVTSSNMVPYPNATASWGSSINNSFAIQTALSEGGSGLKVHGFDWGYRVHSAEPYCAFWLIVCFDNRDPLTRTTVSITNNTGGTLYSVTRDYNDINQQQNFNYSYRFPSSRDLGTLGNFNFTGQTWDNASIDSMYARILYTPDLCMIDPLSSPLCPKYFEMLSRSTSQASNTLVAEPATPQNNVVTNSDSPIQQAGVITATVAPTQTTQQNTFTTASSPQSSQSSSSPPSISLSTILSVVRTEQSRISAIETTTTQQANEVAAALSSEAQSQAEKTAVSASESSQQQSASSLAIGSGITPTQQAFGINIARDSQVTNTETVVLIGPSPIRDQFETLRRDDLGAVQQSQGQRQSEVRRNVRDNDAAAGVTITAMATQPPGYELYQIGLKDVAFYPPKEIYRDQKVIDNERVLRQLNGRSDRLHEEMVNGQYR